MRYLPSVAALVVVLGSGFVLGIYAYKDAWSVYTVPRKVVMDLMGGENPRGGGTRFTLARTTAEADPAASTDISVTDDQIAALEALGYASGTRKAEGASGTQAVVHDATAAKGYYLTSDGQGPTAWIMDETGKILHRWSKAFDEAFPDNDVPDSTAGIGYFRRTALLPGGGLLAVFEGQGIIKLDVDSELVWAYGGRAHHDLEVQPNGTIYTLTRKAHIVDHVNSQTPILEDFVTLLSPDGKELHSFSVLEAVRRSPYRAITVNSESTGDIFHTNSIEVIKTGEQGPKHPAFKAGNLLLSLRETSTILVLDPGLEEVVWATSGVTSRQHHPTMIKNGNMLIFDNYGDLNRTRIVELDPGTGQVVWEYSGRQHDLFTACCGTTYELPDGLIIMTEAENGGARMVDRSGNTVWQYRTPHRVGPNKEYVATLFDVRKLPAEVDLSWLPGNGP